MVLPNSYYYKDPRMKGLYYRVQGLRFTRGPFFQPWIACNCIWNRALEAFPLWGRLQTHMGLGL